MKTHHRHNALTITLAFAATFALSLVLAGCFGSGEPGSEINSPTDASVDASQDAPADTGQNAAGTDAGADAGSDTGRSDAGTDADTDPDAGVETPTPWIFETEELGVLVEADEETIAQETEAPAWSTNGIASANFERPGEEIYSVIVYEDENAARAEVGDSFASDSTVTTASGHTGHVYEANDFGALPDIHVTIPTENFTYYFHSEEEDFGIPEDFLNFIRELELR